MNSYGEVMRKEFALFRLGFRPFFLGAAIFAVLSMLIWMGIYNFSWDISTGRLPVTLWHAHEMLFGYTLAIMAGFLLTAVKTWTDIQTPHGNQLIALFLLWVLTRILFLFITIVPIWIIAAIEILFISLLLASVSIPVFRVKQWRQLIILAIVMLLLISDILFYYGLLTNNYTLLSLGVYTGFYLIIAMIIIMGGRVIPFFIERGVGYPVQLTNRRWLDMSCVVLFIIYAMAELFFPRESIITMLSILLLLCHSLRMIGWYTIGIWTKPLLWVLYIAYGLMVSGFLLRFMSINANISPFLAVHAFGYGGIGVITLGMICRIVWGHTGRNISQPPKAVSWIFTFIITGAIVRVFFPLLMKNYYLLWVGISQLLWIVAFTVFLYIYTPILIRPRPDGKYG